MHDANTPRADSQVRDSLWKKEIDVTSLNTFKPACDAAQPPEEIYEDMHDANTPRATVRALGLFMS